MNTVSNEMTINQAIAAGYKLYGRDEDDYQYLKKLETLKDDDISDSDYTFCVAETEPIYPSVDADALMDYAGDLAYQSNDIADDTDDIYEIMKENKNLFEEISAKLNDLLKKKPYYMLTGIKLITEAHAATQRLNSFGEDTYK